MNPNNPQITHALFGVAAALFVGALVVYGGTFSDTKVAEVADTQVAAFGWLNRNTNLPFQSPGPSDNFCGYNGIVDGHDRYICAQGGSDPRNIFGVFSVSEQHHDPSGAGEIMRVVSNSDSSYLGWRALWRLPQIRINGVSYGPGSATGAYAFVTATFRNDHPQPNFFSLAGDIYTAGNTETNVDKNRREIEGGLHQLTTRLSSVKGGGITVGAGVPLRIEWHCQRYQEQRFHAWCNPGGPFAFDPGSPSCTASRKIDGFNSVDVDSSNPNFDFVAANSDGAQNVSDGLYQDTTLRLRCISPENSGAKRVGMFVDGAWDGSALVQWTIPSRNAPWLTVVIDVQNQIGQHSITANPPEVEVGEYSTLRWRAEFAQRCRVRGPGVNTGWFYGNECDDTSIARVVTPNFTSPGGYTYTLEYVTYSSSGVEQLGSDTVEVTVTGEPVLEPEDPVDPEDPGPGGGGEDEPEPVIDDFSADPMRVRAGSATNLSWSITDFAPGVCAITSNPAGFTHSVSSATAPGEGLSTLPFVINQTTIFTLACSTGHRQATVTVVPAFEEI